VEEDQMKPPAEEQQDRMAQLLTLMSYEANTKEKVPASADAAASLEKLAALYHFGVGGRATPPSRSTRYRS
jgi:hypothetical protein